MHLVEDRKEIEGKVRALDKTLSTFSIKVFYDVFVTKLRGIKIFFNFEYDSVAHILAELTILHLSERRF